MTPVIVLGILFAISTLIMFTAIILNHRLSDKYESLVEKHVALKGAAESLLAQVEEGVVAVARERILKRAMEDFADAEISRAAFVLDVLYGEERNE